MQQYFHPSAKTALQVHHT